MITTPLLLPASARVLLNTEAKSESKQICRHLKLLLDAAEAMSNDDCPGKKNRGMEVLCSQTQIYCTGFEEDAYPKCQPVHLLNKSPEQTTALSSFLVLWLVIL